MTTDTQKLDSAPMTSADRLAQALRREFEAHASELGFDLTRYPEPASAYVSFETRRHWKTWRAAGVAWEAEKAQAVPACWTLTETLDAGETTCSGRLWFTDPKNSAWEPLYRRAALAAAPQPDAAKHEDPENDPRAHEASDWAPPAGYDGDGSVDAMARRAEAAKQAPSLTVGERERFEAHFAHLNKYPEVTPEVRNWMWFAWQAALAPAKQAERLTNTHKLDAAWAKAHLDAIRQQVPAEALHSLDCVRSWLLSHPAKQAERVVKESLTTEQAEPEVTPAMLKAAQMTEAGGYVCANLSGAYELLTLLYKAMRKKSPEGQQAERKQ